MTVTLVRLHQFIKTASAFVAGELLVCAMLVAAAACKIMAAIGGFRKGPRG
ncbi:hypothetical protein [Paraburkholderia sp. JHI869]|uniref:hypothetical protein n=1 Tax=Paraburkholderia sp. JHI869 TaxID=3112959 RepID=UPI0031790667